MPKRSNRVPSHRHQDSLSEASLRERILGHLETLRVRLKADQLDGIVREASEKNDSAWQLLDRFLSVPARERTQASIAARIQRARFPTSAALESFDWAFNPRIPSGSIRELATGEFIRRRDNVTFVGQSGLGKSHLIQGVGRACCAAGYRVRYLTSAALIEDLNKAQAIRALPARVRGYRSWDLLIIDEFGFEKLERKDTPDALSLLYKVIDGRNGHGSTAVLTNVDFGDWTEYLGDPPLVMALLDRVVDRSIIVKFDGKSYRAERATKK